MLDGEEITNMATTTQYAVVDAVVKELDAAVAKFPNQTLAWGGHADWTTQADWYKWLNDSESHTHTWLHILLEEVYEAAAETHPQRICEELMQVAAMAIRAAHDITRRPAE